MDGKKECLTCKPSGKPEDDSLAQRETGCGVEYEAVKVCMEQQSGNIASCKETWNVFRECYGKQKGGKK
jgi:hypothetical protein